MAMGWGESGNQNKGRDGQAAKGGDPSSFKEDPVYWFWPINWSRRGINLVDVA
jgi:hypothetical protein